MRQIIYAMHFKGQASAKADNSSVIRATTTATSCIVRTTVGAQGVEGTFQAAEGDLAFFESEVQLTGPDSFSEKGTITFGDNHLLRFSSLQNGYIGPGGGPDIRLGAVSWKVEGGEGQFADAMGTITSNFTLSETGEVNDYHFGVIFVP